MAYKAVKAGVKRVAVPDDSGLRQDSLMLWVGESPRGGLAYYKYHLSSKRFPQSPQKAPSMFFQTARDYIKLSIVAAIVTMGLKIWAYYMTGSIGLFSDAAESSVNLVAALTALWMLTLAAQPPDQEHPFGHSKAEYFSSAVEGILVLAAAIAIMVSGINRLLSPTDLAQIPQGIGISLVASAINGSVALILLKAGKRLRSIALRADARHLLTDVWTTFGITIGLVLVKLTGWQILDPLLAIAVAIHIASVGIQLLKETTNGLMDVVLSKSEQSLIHEALCTYQSRGIQFHALRTRRAGTRSFVSFHVLVPGTWSVKQGHDLCEEIELMLMRSLPGAHVMTHLEPLDDPQSWADESLDRLPTSGFQGPEEKAFNG